SPATRVRPARLPLLAEACGAEALENLARFAATVEEFERQCAARTEPLAWQAPRFALARRGAGEEPAGRALARRALARLLSEASGHTPGRILLEKVLATLRQGWTGDWVLPGGWRLGLRRRWL